MDTMAQIMAQINEMGYKNKITLNEATVAKIIGVSSSTLSNWRKDGLGPNYRKIDNGKKGKVIYTKQSVAEWLSQTVLTA
ncbi:helix-turn-helix transcriptional regulator [Arcobacter sp. FWKO B]|uniref:helix-turn-helix transcriptional regulator n=1 Tax=Arcobacter sp. FWKO B TaxID=2593672 RepID=UPI001D18B5AE|nr:helix-turn-helix domain-containing protein [Arcobacter sp. FWKO B]